MVLAPPSTGDSDRVPENVVTTDPDPPEPRSTTMKRITIIAAGSVLAVTPALGDWAAFASNDDAPASHQRVADDHGRHHRHHGADDKIVVKGAKVHAKHGADDAAGHQRHSGEAEPGD